MHLEKDILKGKHFKKGELKKEAREELEEMKEKVKGKMKHHSKGSKYEKEIIKKGEKPYIKSYPQQGGKLK